MTQPVPAECILLVDAGNTRTKWAVCDTGDALDAPFSATGAFLNTEIPDVAPPAWQGCARAVLASVASSALTARMEALLHLADIDVSRTEPALETCGLKNGYADPKQLGVDRWAAAVAAWHHAAAPCVVVSAGTALTIDAIGTVPDGNRAQFLGGLIVPGFRLMQQGLLQNAARLGDVAGVLRPFPDNTGDAVYSGAAAAMTGAVLHMLRLLQQREGSKPRCILGGGDAHLLVPALAMQGGFENVTVVDNLVLRGLQLIERDCS